MLEYTDNYSIFMSKIPKIIHQIWSGIDEPLPQFFRLLSETWKKHYPDWEYILWDNHKMNKFILDFYPDYKIIYDKFPYNVQRWDAIRYLILNKLGGLYADFDYESIKPLTGVIKESECCFGLEPQSHSRLLTKNVGYVVGNALMLSVPGHPFMQKIIDTVFVKDNVIQGKTPRDIFILNTTGPWMLTYLYEGLSAKEKENIYTIPAKYVAPFNLPQAHRAISGEISEELEMCLDEAYAVHYFFSGWRKSDK